MNSIPIFYLVNIRAKKSHLYKYWVGQNVRLFFP